MISKLQNMMSILKYSPGLYTVVLRKITPSEQKTNSPGL